MPQLDYDISLARCPKLQDRKEALLHYWRSVIKKHETVSTMVEEIIASQDSELFLSFVLDCSSVPRVARAAQSDSTVLPLLYKVTEYWELFGKKIVFCCWSDHQHLVLLALQSQAEEPGQVDGRDRGLREGGGGRLLSVSSLCL